VELDVLAAAGLEGAVELVAVGAAGVVELVVGVVAGG
jgi:hypothetical protein